MRPRPGAGAGACSAGPTPWQTVGPYLAIGFEPIASPHRDAIPAGSIRLSGRVLDGTGLGLPDAVVETWNDRPAPEPALPGSACFSRCLTDADGRYEVVTPRPVAATIGPGPDQAPHLELMVFARGLIRALRTRVYLPDETGANEGDPVLRAVADEARRATLVATRDGADRAAYRFDVRIQASGGLPETVFFA
ncbi:MAG: protocatechuate 3,4-dioxygenase subunit alpha [Actinomycetota bacterium]|nr:protocatechuate 3,4-dioxygenase subunit alpha [Actinomycetota bacterium]